MIRRAANHWAARLSALDGDWEAIGEWTTGLRATPKGHPKLIDRRKIEIAAGYEQ